MIAQANAGELEKALQAVLSRYGELYPDWAVTTVSIDRKRQRNEQLDAMMRMLETLKNEPEDL